MTVTDLIALLRKEQFRPDELDDDEWTLGWNAGIRHVIELLERAAEDEAP